MMKVMSCCDDKDWPYPLGGLLKINSNKALSTLKILTLVLGRIQISLKPLLRL
jgi:hypothetical protein